MAPSRIVKPNPAAARYKQLLGDAARMLEQAISIAGHDDAVQDAFRSLRRELGDLQMRFWETVWNSGSTIKRAIQTAGGYMTRLESGSGLSAVTSTDRASRNRARTLVRDAVNVLKAALQSNRDLMKEHERIMRIPEEPKHSYDHTYSAKPKMGRDPNLPPAINWSTNFRTIDYEMPNNPRGPSSMIERGLQQLKQAAAASKSKPGERTPLGDAELNLSIEFRNYKVAGKVVHKIKQAKMMENIVRQLSSIPGAQGVSELSAGVREALAFWEEEGRKQDEARRNAPRKSPQRRYPASLYGPKFPKI